MKSQRKGILAPRRQERQKKEDSLAPLRENELFLNKALHVTCSFADTSTPDRSILSYVFSDRAFFVRFVSFVVRTMGCEKNADYREMLH